MSYILDALRKADAQRERDPARGIHAQPVQTSPLQRPEGQQTRLWLWGTALVISAGLLAVAAWQLARPAAPVVAVPVATPVAVAPAAEVVIAAAPVVPMPLPATAVLPAAPPAPPVSTAAPLPLVLKPAATLAAPAPVPGSPAPDRVLSVKDLPADVQRDLPKLAISGGVYSSNPAQRMLIVNGQVVGEGTEPAPGVVLEQIRAKTAVLKFRGYRYAVAY